MYFVLGAVTACIGLVALIAWAIEHWRAGERTEVVLVSLLVAIIAGSVGFAMRRRRPVFVLAAAFMLVGVVAYVLASHGISLPANWFG